MDVIRMSDHGRLIEYEGKEYTIGALAKKIGMSKSTLRGRLIDQGLTVEQAINKPLRKYQLSPCKSKSFYDCFDCEYPDCVRNGWVHFKDAPESIWKMHPVEGIGQ